MSSVVPNGQIRFFENVPIDSNYENSLDFLTKEAQYEYFLGLTFKHRMIGATRVRDGVISVDTVSDNLLNCNYMMFQNENFSAKWFFAFIIDVQYVNNNMCYVFYQIDDIQTWMFDVTLKQCFVEREHTITDGLFEHLVDENIGTSEYTCVTEGSKTYSNYVAILYTSSRQQSGLPVYANCQIRNGVLKGLSGYVFDLQDNNGNWLELRPSYDDPSDPTEFDNIMVNGNGLEKLNAWVWLLVSNNYKDSIVSINIVPKYFVGSTDGDVGISQLDAVSDNLGFTNFSLGESLDSNYTPTNKKLYNSPYTVIDIVTGDGQSIHLQPEFLQTGNNLVNILSCISPLSNLLIVPKWYKNCEFAWDKSISCDVFSQASVSTDGYSAWVASGGLKSLNAQMQTHALNGVFGVTQATLTGNSVGVASSIASSLINISQDMNKLEVAKSLPPEVKGSIDASPLSANKNFSIGYRKMSLKKDTLQSIDNYFTMFGYKVNKVKTPSRRNRPHYTYLKTKGCHVDGGAPADAIQRIETIYDNGIRFWVNANEVGNFSVNNAPV